MHTPTHPLIHTTNCILPLPFLASLKRVVSMRSLQCYCQLFCKQPLFFECQQNPYVCSFPLPSTISWTSTDLLIFQYFFLCGFIDLSKCFLLQYFATMEKTWIWGLNRSSIVDTTTLQKKRLSCHFSNFQFHSSHSH